MSGDRTDQDLLRAFASRRDEEAFRLLAARHADVVFGTALRIVRERPAAQEITQNVLIALARKAAFLPRDLRLGAWLHRCACWRPEAGCEAKCGGNGGRN